MSIFYEIRESANTIIRVSNCQYIMKQITLFDYNLPIKEIDQTRSYTINMSQESVSDLPIENQETESEKEEENYIPPPIEEMPTLDVSAANDVFTVIGMKDESKPIEVNPHKLYVFPQGKPIRMPRLMKTVHEQILGHPDYMTKLSRNLRWCYEAGCVQRGSWCDKENNAWSRKIWRFLYENGPDPHP